MAIFYAVRGRTSSHFLDGHNEERPIISQPQHGCCHRYWQQWSYALNWCKSNNDDDNYTMLLTISQITHNKYNETVLTGHCVMSSGQNSSMSGGFLQYLYRKPSRTTAVNTVSLTQQAANLHN